MQPPMVVILKHCPDCICLIRVLASWQAISRSRSQETGGRNHYNATANHNIFAEDLTLSEDDPLKIVG